MDKIPALHGLDFPIRADLESWGLVRSWSFLFPLLEFLETYLCEHRMKKVQSILLHLFITLVMRRCIWNLGAATNKFALPWDVDFWSGYHIRRITYVLFSKVKFVISDDITITLEWHCKIYNFGHCTSVCSNVDLMAFFLPSSLLCGLLLCSSIMLQIQNLFTLTSRFFSFI